MVNIRYIFLLLFFATCFIGCKKDESDDATDMLEAEKLTPHEKKVIDNLNRFVNSLNNAPSLDIENGQAAVIKIPEGYLFAVPVKSGVISGKYIIYFSENGDFKKNGKIIEKDSWGPEEDGFTEIKGHGMFFLSSFAENFVRVALTPGERPNTTAIAKYQNTDPNSVDVSTLEFIENPGLDLDEDVLDALMKEREERFKDQNQ